MHCRIYAKGVRTSFAKPITNPSQVGPQIDPKSTPNRPQNDSGGALGHPKTPMANVNDFRMPPGPNAHYFLGYFWDPFFFVFWGGRVSAVLLTSLPDPEFPESAPDGFGRSRAPCCAIPGVAGGSFWGRPGARNSSFYYSQTTISVFLAFPVL